MRNCDTCAFWCHSEEEPQGFPCACCVDTSRWEPHPLLARLEAALPGDCGGCIAELASRKCPACYGCRRNNEARDGYERGAEMRPTSKEEAAACGR